MINITRITPFSRLNLKKIALASGLTIAAMSVSVPARATSKSENNIKQVQNSHTIQTNQIKPLDQDVFVASYKNYDNNQTTNTSLANNSFKQENDSIQQTTQLQLEDAKNVEEKPNFLDIERDIIEENQTDIKNEIQTNIANGVNISDETFDNRKAYHERLSVLIKDAVDLRLNSLKNTTPSEDKIVTALMHRASKYNDKDQFKQKMADLYGNLNDTEKEIYQTVRYNDNYKIHVGCGVSKKLVKYEVKKECGDYVSHEQDDLDIFINNIIDKNVLLAMKGKIKEPADIDLTEINVYANKEVYRQLLENKQERDDERNMQRAKHSHSNKHTQRAKEALAVMVGERKANEILKSSGQYNGNIESYLRGR